MVRRRTAVVSIAAVGLLLASPALTACGSGPARAGAAAVVGDHRITVSTLEAKVNEVRSAEAKSPQGAQLIDNSGKLSTQTLSTLVQNEVIDKAVRKAGVTVSETEVQQNHAQALQQFGGSEAQLEAALLTQYGIAPSGVDEFFRTNVEVGKLIQSLGFQPGSDNGNAAVLAALSKTADSLGVRINPRYGTWDAKKAVIGTATDAWVVDKTPPAADQSA
ncbi:SurA N-terminal domain-containing protein [Actinacidiphila acididurans]|uniref:SurA N-terminal domain-containing protein n=1 Tax=Actinacidiphila acididurans TaxID=2784346 RepID=A0ABS2TNS1_9ACTN|nr:SurA N-terminal domain-containing protein [Actinacidiphila acididurans]MBM9504989.1 SurA N-terminal domain-containing protein [Actinacidiphila acididurans]